MTSAFGGQTITPLRLWNRIEQFRRRPAYSGSMYRVAVSILVCRPVRRAISVRTLSQWPGGRPGSESGHDLEFRHLVRASSYARSPKEAIRDVGILFHKSVVLSPKQSRKLHALPCKEPASIAFFLQFAGTNGTPKCLAACARFAEWPPFPCHSPTLPTSLFHDLQGPSFWPGDQQCSGVVRMETRKYLTAEEVVERYREEISLGTLRNWRAMRIGPPFVKIGKAVLYPIEELNEWDKKNLVMCRVTRRSGVIDNEEQ